MITSDFTTTLVVEQTPKQAFSAINNVRGWWSEEIEGNTSKLNDEFTYHYEDVHYCKIKLIEVTPYKKVVWLVMDNYFNFTKDKSEWKNTRVIFEISQKDNKTQIRFTHMGLVPQYECYDICRDAWSNYIKNSLRSLITTGKGQPNPKGGRNDYQESVSNKIDEKNFHTSLIVDASAREAFNAINNVRGWWSEDFEGSSQKVNDAFTVRFGDVHFSKQRLIEAIPDRKVVWLVTDSKLNFIKNKQEWTHTKIIFELTRQDNKTRIDFTHFGLVPEYECFDACSNAWTDYLRNSLKDLITTGKGQPNRKENKSAGTKRAKVVS